MAQSSLEKLRGIQVTVVHNYIWKDSLETSGRILEISPSIEKVIGYTREEHLEDYKTLLAQPNK